jgi:hypothetical protein
MTKFNYEFKNESYVLMGTKNFTEKYYKDENGWLKISMTGKI